MRNLRTTVAALSLGLILGAATVQLQAAIPSGGGGSGPIEPTPGGIIGQVNTYLGSYLSVSGASPTAASELQFFQAGSWATNSNVATTMTSLGPQGASTTVSKWLTVKDNTGNPGFIPFYACGSSACR